MLYTMHATYAIHAHRDFSIGAESTAFSTTCCNYYINPLLIFRHETQFGQNTRVTTCEDICLI